MNVTFSQSSLFGLAAVSTRDAPPFMVGGWELSRRAERA
jgi:hypothetical protein